MRQKAIIVRRITVSDEAGFPQKTDVVVQSGTAFIDQKSETTDTADGRRRTASTVECRIRFSRGATMESGMTMITGGRRYTIQSAEDAGGRHMWWKLSAAEEAVHNG